MYQLSRLLLFIAAFAACFSVVMMVTWTLPASGILLAVVMVVRFARGGYKRLTTLGSARWAEAEELRRAGMICSSSGLMLGRLPPSRRIGAFGAIRALVSLRLSAAEACRAFWSGWRRRSEMVTLPNPVHTAVFSPTGGGKGVSFAVPFLLTCPDSCVVVDFKGELAQLTAENRRKRLGHRVVLLDPFRVVTANPDRFNPLSFIDSENPLSLDECNDLANALVVRTGEEKEPHWNDSALAWISALVATVVRYGEAGEETRSLQTIREILSRPDRLDLAIKLMSESDAWQGMLARLGGQLQHFVEKERASTLTTVSRHLRFLDTLSVAESTKSSTFDPAELNAGKMTVYLILPPDHMRAQSALLRVWIGSLLRAVVRGGLDAKRRVHFILDEAASLGHLEAVDDAVDKYRGFGVRLQFYFQSLGQLKKCFPDGQEQTLLSNTTQIFFGVNDNATADYVSARLGEETICVASGGTSTGRSRQWNDGGRLQGSGGSSSNANRNWAQQARKLLKPEEVISLSPRTAITFTPGVRPIRTTLIRYYEERGLGTRRGWIRRGIAACSVLAASATLCALSLLLAVAMAEANAPAGTTKAIRKPLPPQQEAPMFFKAAPERIRQR